MNLVIQITQNGMGSGSEELSLILAKNYFNLLIDENRLPKAILVYNEGVKVLCADSPVIESLKKVEEMGVKIIACKTCLNFYKLQDKLSVGIMGTMSDILEYQTLADKVINL